MNRWHRRFLGTTSLPADLTDFEVEHYFTLTPAAVDAVRSRYKDNHRIAVAIQLGFLKLSGRPLAALKVVPAKLLRHVGKQLGVEAPSIASLRTLYRRRATLYAHQAWAVEQSGLSSCGRTERAALGEFFSVEAGTAESVDALVQSGREWLYEHRLLVPATSTLRDLAVAAYTATDRGNYELICAEVPAATRERWLEVLFQRCEEDDRTVLQWLRQPPRRQSPSTIRREFRKIDFLKELGVEAFSLRGIPLEKLRGYAQRLRSQRPARFAAVTEPRRTLELVGFLHVALLDTTDGIVQLTGRGTLSLVRKARTKTGKMEVERLQSYKALVNDLEAVLVDTSLPAATAREQALDLIRQAPPEPFATKAAATRHALSERNDQLRTTLKRLTSLDIRGSDERVLGALQRLRDLYTQNKPSLPEGDLPPCRSVWRELVGGVDRQRALRAFEAATLLDVRRGLKSGSLWIAHSAAYRDPALHLLDEQRWQRERRHLEGGQIRIGALEAEPLAAEVDRLKSELFRDVGTVRIPANVTGVSDQRDRTAPRRGTGASFLLRAVTFGQDDPVGELGVSAGLAHRSSFQLEAL